MTTDLLDMRQVAELLGVHMNTVSRLVGHYKIPHIRLTSKCIRFNRSDIETWIRSRRITNPQEHKDVLSKEAVNG